MRLILLLSFAAAVGVGVLSLTPPGRLSSLGADQACLNHLYARDLPDAQVVITGSSRVQRGLDPRAVAAELGLADSAVVNFAHPGAAPLFDYDIVNAALAAGRLKPDVLVVGVIATSAMQREIEKNVTGETALDRVTISNGDVDEIALKGTRLPTLIGVATQDEPNSIMAAWNAARLVSERLSGHVKLALAGRSIWDVHLVNPKIDQDRTNICFRSNWDRDRTPLPRVAAFKASYKSLFDGQPPKGDLDPASFLSDPFFKPEHLALRRIAAMAETHGIKVYALFVPGIYTPQLPQGFIAQFETTFGMPLVTFDADLRARLEDGHYFDPTHLTRAGRDIASGWLAGKIARDVLPR